MNENDVISYIIIIFVFAVILAVILYYFFHQRKQSLQTAFFTPIISNQWVSTQYLIQAYVNNDSGPDGELRQLSVLVELGRPDILLQGIENLNKVWILSVQQNTNIALLFNVDFNLYAEYPPTIFSTLFLGPELPVDNSYFVVKYLNINKLPNVPEGATKAINLFVRGDETRYVITGGSNVVINTFGDPAIFYLT